VRLILELHWVSNARFIWHWLQYIIGDSANSSKDFFWGLKSFDYRPSLKQCHLRCGFPFARDRYLSVGLWQKAAVLLTIWGLKIRDIHKQPVYNHFNSENDDNPLDLGGKRFSDKAESAATVHRVPRSKSWVMPKVVIATGGSPWYPNCMAGYYIYIYIVYASIYLYYIRCNVIL